ncbi:MAG: hypothetical protein OEW67_14125 [Cyclobacteriaceae bacterium]|nr:hypothetical protein [Cyclobacteriaceae bacterium]
MNEFITFFIAIIGLTFLSAGWVALQYLARKMKTKNHFDDLNSSCGNCMCGGDTCSRE